MSAPAKVAILGAESSGKSTLAAALAERYGSTWVPEYLREFVATQQRVPHASDQFSIARTQLQREAQAQGEAARLAAGYLFCDTTPLMTALYSRFYFHEIDPGTAALAQAHDYAFTLVTAPDGPWMPDGLQRESEAVRQTIHRQLLDELARRAIPYLLVEGSLENRLQQVGRLLSRPGAAV
jgi:NadR type nicotinamide-nucleotide adenylyltransferase